MDGGLSQRMQFPWLNVWVFLPLFFLPVSLCIFCGERDETFTEEGLDLHYWKHCPMLTRCDFCKQVSLPSFPEGLPS